MVARALRSPDLWTGIVLMLVGFLFLAGTAEIVLSEEGLIGPRFVPQIVSSLLVALGGALAWSGARSAVPVLGEAGPALPWRAAVVVLIGIFYVQAFMAVGYFLSTIFATAAALLLFGVRRPLSLMLGSILVAIVWYITFVRLMGVFDPPGRLLSFQPWLPL